MNEATIGWDNFFVAEAGAAAALAGLLFVAASINLKRILEFPTLPTRLAEALCVLLSVLVLSTFSLVPRQPMHAYALEILGTGGVFWLLQTLALVRTRPDDKHHSGPIAMVSRILLNQAPPITIAVAGARLLAGHANGIFWLVPATLTAFAAGLFGAWVLLIEIQR
ncbi:MAG: hypothetical protein JST92_08940 [Deltaproteobacteria bacterium]|nr:hypothetical protein [Deltaproteobacteria bacterium]